MSAARRFPKTRADLILDALAKRHAKDRRNPDVFLTEVKTGATWGNPDLLKFDGLAVRRSWAHPLITGYEVKVDHGDFLRDDKWHGYLQYCHEFYFVCPSGLIAPEELSTDVGLIFYNPETGTLTTKRKAVYRRIEIPAAMFYYITLSRGDEERHPFFTDRRAFLEAWVQDKQETRLLGRTVESKMASELSELAGRLEEAQRKLEHRPGDGEKLRQLQAVIANTLRIGDPWGNWEWYLDCVQKCLSSPARMPPDIDVTLQGLEHNVAKLRRLIEGQEVQRCQG